MDFAIGLVNSVLNLPDGQVKFFEEFRLRKNCEMTFGLVAQMASCKNDFLCSLLSSLIRDRRFIEAKNNRMH